MAALLDFIACRLIPEWGGLWRQRTGMPSTHRTMGRSFSTAAGAVSTRTFLFGPLLLGGEGDVATRCAPLIDSCDSVVQTIVKTGLSTHAVGNMPLQACCYGLMLVVARPCADAGPRAGFLAHTPTLLFCAGTCTSSKRRAPTQCRTLDLR
jgi:hypothetical protein